MMKHMTTPYLPQAAIFDLDGTLLDSMWVWKQIDADFLASFGHQVTPDYTDAIKAMTWEDGARYTIDRYGLPKTPEQVIDIWLDMARDYYRTEVKLKPGAKAYLDYLHAHQVPMAIATSMCPVENIEIALSANGLTGYFSSITHSSEVTRDKSHPDIYLLAAERLGMDPANCAVFEDILAAVKGAQEGGFQTVAIFDPISENDWARIETTATLAVRSWNDLLNKKENCD